MTFRTIAARTLSLAALVTAGLLVLPACSDDKGEEACNKLKSLCNSSSTSDGGVSQTTTVTCDADKFNELSNKDDVADCMDKAKDCNAATACLLTAKP